MTGERTESPQLNVLSKDQHLDASVSISQSMSSEVICSPTFAANKAKGLNDLPPDNLKFKFLRF